MNKPNPVSRGDMARLSSMPFVLGLISSPAFAQGVATDAQVEVITVTGKRERLDRTLPTSTASITAEQLREHSVFNPEDAVALLPSINIRKRWNGDRNATMGGRSYSVLQPGRSLVFVDGYLISNFLGNFDAPRWNMVNMEAVERIDALYGPFSAIYPGNSIGTTILLTERKPRAFEVSGSLRYNDHDFNEYGTSRHYRSKQLSARIGSRMDSGLWWTLGFQHQDSRGQPENFANVVAPFGPAGAGTRVTGTYYDKDPQHRDRVVFGDRGVEHTLQDTVNLRLGYDISPTQLIEGRVSVWRGDSTVGNGTYLRDAAGAPVWSGVVNDGVNSFSIPANTFLPSARKELNRSFGLTWKTRRPTGWNASAVFTHYKMLRDINRVGSQPQPLGILGGAGTVTRRDGTGWNTLEFQATYTPTEGDFGGGRHALVFGLHRNSYQLRNIVNNATDWRTTETTVNQSYVGKTAISALYAQDAWKLTPDLTLTSGLRYEFFEGRDGAQYFAGPPVAQQVFANRNIQAASPKLSLAWDVTGDLLLRASFGRGVRFPNVDDLFNGTKTGATVVTGDPNLRPEVADSVEFSAERSWNGHWIRASLFRDDVKDTILRQTDITVTPVVTRISNVDRVLAQGLELVWRLNDVLVDGLDIGGSATWADVDVKANTANPGQVGKQWPRIPKQRYLVEASYRPAPQWLLAATWRWNSSAFNTPTNIDTNTYTYGAISRLDQLDLKAGWKFARGWEWSLGATNVTGEKSYQAHSMPQRAIQTELRFAIP